MEEILIEAGWVFQPNGNLLKDASILIENGKIVKVGKIKSSEIASDVQKIVFKKGLIVPPFINAHTHLPETLIRGLCDDADLQDWLFKHVWIV